MSQSDKDRLLDTLRNVDMDKIEAHVELQNDQIEELLCILSDNQEDLNDWEEDFFYDLNLRFEKGQNISEAQFDKLREVAYKYDPTC